MATRKRTKPKATTRKRTKPKRATSLAWAEQGALAALEDARRVRFRRRLARFDDATLARLRGLFARLVHVLACEIPADDATIDAIARAHDLFFPARAQAIAVPPADRIAAALGPIATACAEAHRGGEGREHARYARWQLARLVDPAFGALAIDELALGIERAARATPAAKRARKIPTPTDLLVAWNKLAGEPLGALTKAAIRRISERRRPAPRR